MAIIGLLLLVAAGVVAVDIAGMNDQAATVDAFGHTYATSLGAVLVVGVVTALVAALGLLLLENGIQARRRHMRARREAIEERESLTRELEKERQAREDVERRIRIDTGATGTATATNALAAREVKAAERHIANARAVSDRPIDVRDETEAPVDDHVRTR